MNAYSQSCNTLASHMTTFTGLFPDSHGVKVPLRDNLPPGLMTLGTAFHNAGYKTLWVGPVGYPNLEPIDNYAAGFDQILQPPGYSPPQPAAWDYVRQSTSPFLLFFHSFYTHNPAIPKPETYQRLFGHELNWTRERMNDALRRWVLQDLHRVFREETLTRHPELLRGDDPDARWARIEKLGEYPELTGTSLGVVRMQRFWHELDASGEGTVEARRMYQGSVSEVDEMIGEIYARLSDLGMDDRTLFIFMSDHGDEFRDHGELNHQQLYEESVHVPLLILGPGVPAGQRRPEIVELTDVLPTLLDLVGIPRQWPMDGQSLAPLIDGDGPWQAKTSYSTWFDSFAIRDERFTLLRPRQQPNTLPTIFLFDRHSDPHERTDVSDLYPEVLKKLRDFVTDRQGHTKRPAQPAWPTSIDDRRKASLLKTGYW